MIIVMGCTTNKAAGSRPAFDKYVARQHTKLRDELPALWAAGHAVYILSAEFGLVPANQPLPDYDRKMDAARAAYLEQDVMMTLKEVEDDHEEILVYGGKLYRELIERVSDLPVSGLVGANRGCGDHYSALCNFMEDYI